MARILYGGGVADMRGKQNGTVFSRNQYGNYVRAKVTPKNPRSTYQVAVRANLSLFSKRWGSTLTDAGRSAWNAASAVFPVRNVFGNSIILSGIALYQRLNLTNALTGGAVIDTPPASLAVTSNTSITVVANHTGPVFTITMLPATLATGELLYIWATPALPPGRKFLKTYYRYIGTHAASGTAISITSLWTARFGTFPAAAGQRIGVLVGVVSSVTGAVSPGIQSSTLVI